MLLILKFVAQAATGRYFFLLRQKEVTKKKAVGGNRGKSPPHVPPEPPSIPPLDPAGNGRVVVAKKANAVALYERALCCMAARVMIE